MESLTLTEVTSETENEKDLQLSYTSSSGNERSQACHTNSSIQTISRHLNTREKGTGVTGNVRKPCDRFLSSHNKDQLLESKANQNLLGNIDVEQDLVSETVKCNIRRKNKNALPRRSISSNVEQDRQKMNHSQSYSGELPLGKENPRIRNKNAVLRRSKSSLDTSKEQYKGLHNSPPQQRDTSFDFVKATVSSQTDDESYKHSCKKLSHLKIEKDNESRRQTELAKNEKNSESYSGFSLPDNQGYQAEAGLALPIATSTNCLKKYQTEAGLAIPNARSTSIVNEWQTDEGPALPSMTSTSIENSAKLEKFVSICTQAKSTLQSEIGCDDSLKDRVVGTNRHFVLLFPTGDQEEAQRYADHLKSDIGTHDLHNLTVDLFSDIDSGQTAIQSALYYVPQTCQVIGFLVFFKRLLLRVDTKENVEKKTELFLFGPAKNVNRTFLH